MGKLIKCPHCLNSSDVGENGPGTIVACATCNAQLKVPAGAGISTAEFAKATPQTEQKIPPSPRRGRRGFRRVFGSRRSGVSGRGQTKEGPGRQAGMEKPQQNNAALIVGLVAAGLVIVVLFVALGKKEEERPQTRRSTTPGTTSAQTSDTATIPSASSTPPPAVNPASLLGNEPTPVPQEKSSGGNQARWDHLISNLKNYAPTRKAGFYNFDDPPGDARAGAFHAVESMGRQAYPYLLAYVTNEDLPRAQGAAAALWTILKKPGRVPTKPGEGAAIQQELMKELQVSEQDVKNAEAEVIPK